jgi:hypothetical protein
MTRAAAKAVSLDERVFMCVSQRSSGYSILTGITQQGPWELQRPEEKVYFKRHGAVHFAC